MKFYERPALPNLPILPRGSRVITNRHAVGSAAKKAIKAGDHTMLRMMDADHETIPIMDIPIEERLPAVLGIAKALLHEVEDFVDIRAVQHEFAILRRPRTEHLPRLLPRGYALAADVELIDVDIAGTTQLHHEIEPLLEDYRNLPRDRYFGDVYSRQFVRGTSMMTGEEGNFLVDVEPRVWRSYRAPLHPYGDYGRNSNPD